MRIRQGCWVAAAMLVVACGCGMKKDVEYVTTPRPVVRQMLRLAEVKAADVVYDLGCGDGRIVIMAAAEHGARGVGIDIDPMLITRSQDNACRAGVAERVEFRQADLFESDFSEATVVTLYLLPRLNLRLRPKLLAMRPGTRVVSYRFDMQDWKPDRHVALGDDDEVYLWVVPARVEGVWEVVISGPSQPTVMTLELKQTYQQVSGAAIVDGRRHELRDVRLRGDELTFTLPLGILRARVEGEQMTGGRVSPPNDSWTWTARRR